MPQTIAQKINKAAVARLAAKHGVDLEKLPLETLVAGARVEFLEHGPKSKHGVPAVISTVEEAVLIALGHLVESIHYYDELEKLEDRLKARHRLHRNPRIIARS